MTRTIPVISNLEELAAKALRDGDVKFTLHSWYGEAYNDAAAGAAYETAKAAAYAAIAEAEETYAKAAGQRVDYQAESRAEQAWREGHPQPAQHTQYIYSLRTAGSRYGSHHLSNELGEQVYAIWTKRKDQLQFRHPETAGTLALKTIVARLGVSDIGAQMKAAQSKAARNDKARRINAARDRVLKAIEALSAAQANLDAVLGTELTIVEQKTVGDLFAAAAVAEEILS